RSLQSRFYDQRMDVRLQRLQRLAERSAHFFDGGNAGHYHVPSRALIEQQEIDGSSEHVAIGDTLCTALVYQALIGFTEILDIAPRQDDRLQHRRFQRVLTTLGGQ